MNRDTTLVRQKITTSTSSNIHFHFFIQTFLGDNSPFQRKRLTKSTSRENTSIKSSSYQFNERQSDLQTESSKAKLFSNGLSKKFLSNVNFQF